MPPSIFEQFFLFGDSITQGSGSQERGFGFSPALQDAYIRRLDVVNRGFSGYNTKQALKVLPHIIPSPDVARLRFFFLFFGANDAATPRPELNQHVTLEEYKENLVKILTHPLLKAHNPHIILIAPPPINEHAPDFDRVLRTAPTTKSYAEGAIQVANQLGVAFVDLWSAFMSRTGWNDGEPVIGSWDVAKNVVLDDLMHDGLHFNPQGYKILFDEVMKVIAKNWPDELPEKLPMVLPEWGDAEAWSKM